MKIAVQAALLLAPIDGPTVTGDRLVAVSSFSMRKSRPCRACA
jgi:hypothetical protein